MGPLAGIALGPVLPAPCAAVAVPVAALEVLVLRLAVRSRRVMGGHGREARPDVPAGGIGRADGRAAPDGRAASPGHERVTAERCSRTVWHRCWHRCWRPFWRRCGSPCCRCWFGGWACGFCGWPRRFRGGRAGSAAGRGGSAGERRTRQDRAYPASERRRPQGSGATPGYRSNAGPRTARSGFMSPARGGSSQVAGAQAVSAGPEIPAHIEADQLDRRVRTELKTLPRDLADRVARHLAAADQAERRRVRVSACDRGKEARRPCRRRPRGLRRGGLPRRPVGGGAVRTACRTTPHRTQRLRRHHGRL